jgi:uroporphyrinogen decarboxylase
MRVNGENSKTECDFFSPSFAPCALPKQSVAECTLQPLRRYEVDAAILFSDILVIAEALGIEVTMPGGVGIQVPQPLAGPEEVAKRIPHIDQISASFVEDKLGHVLEAVRQIRQKMQEEEKNIPLIGFSAAPWTLLFYMVGGSSRKNTDIGMKWLNDHPEESQALLTVLTKVVIEYMSAQVENGAHMLQVFEAMGMMIDEENFDKFALPCLKEISKELKTRFPDVPLMVFSRGASFANADLSKLEFDVITIDGSVDRATARSIVGNKVALQGNYDPRELIEDDEGSKTPETVRNTVREMLEALGPQKLIANLGEGLGGKESPRLVNAFVNTVHEESATMIQAAAR